MFFYFSRFLIQLALPIFLKALRVFGKQNLNSKTPYIIASNHSGSFFDALVIGSVVKKQINTLARGDVFKKPAVAFWLRQIKLIPVFRGTEGRQYVKNHGETTKEAYDALKSGGNVVVFSEGICKNEWNLRPLGKGTARMAYETWYGPNPIHEMRVLPTGVNYEHFRGPGKRVVLNFGNEIKQTDIQTDPEEYEKWLREFTELLAVRMSAEILSVNSDLPANVQQQEVKAYFDQKAPVSPHSNPVLGVLGALGRFIHKPIYHFFERKAAKLTARTVFYDSVLFGLLIYLYPIIVLLISQIIGFVFGYQAAIICFVTLPLLIRIGANQS